MVDDYTIEKHQHRLAAWAASTAARASRRLCPFKVKQGVAILEACRFNVMFSIKDLPNPKDIDQEHKKWRKDIIKAAQKIGLKGFSHGVAAKLINCYLKVRFVCAGQHENERVQSLHPPIDRVLLKKLAEKKIGGFEKEWRQFNKVGWSKFGSHEYEEVINLIRKSLTEQSLWKIEEYWDGYQ